MKVCSVFAAVILSLGMAVPANAVTFDILATAIKGSHEDFAGIGTITFDETLVPEMGGEILSVSSDPTLALSVTFGSLTFTEANDADFRGLPQFVFNDGILTSIDYVVEDGQSGAKLARYGVSAFAFVDDLFFNVDEKRFEVGVVTLPIAAAVPLPSGLPLLAGGLGLFAFLRRRRS